MAVIYAFGDSITYGAWDVAGSGRASRLRVWIDAKADKDAEYYCLLYNLGIPGETTRGLVKRFETEIKARDRDSENENAVFIFAFGANDSALLDNEGNFAVSIDEFGSNLAGVIEKAKTISKKIILLNITPVIDEITGKPNHRDKVRLNKYIEQYNKAVDELATKHDVAHLDIYSLFMNAGHTKLFDEDGLHPNSLGHKIIFDAVRPVLEKLLQDHTLSSFTSHH